VIDSVGGVVADDLPRAIDAEGHGAAGRRRIVEGSVHSAAITDEAVHDQHGVQVNAHDLAGGVDTERSGAANAQGIIDGGVSAVVGVVEEAMGCDGADTVTADNKARGVDAKCNGAVRPAGRGIIEGYEGAAA